MQHPGLQSLNPVHSLFHHVASRSVLDYSFPEFPRQRLAGATNRLGVVMKVKFSHGLNSYGPITMLSVSITPWFWATVLPTNSCFPFFPCSSFFPELTCQDYGIFPYNPQLNKNQPTNQKL